MSILSKFTEFSKQLTWKNVKKKTPKKPLHQFTQPCCFDAPYGNEEQFSPP